MHHHKHGFHKSFDDAEKWSKKFDDPARDKWQLPDETINALKLGANDKVLDLGAGTGYFSLRIAKAYPNVTVYAADVEPDMVEYLRKQTAQRALPNHIPVIIAGNSVELPHQVNTVIVVDTYHHIDNRPSYFGALKKHIVHGGKIVIVDFKPDSPEGPPPDHRISKAQLITEMEEAGYSVEQDVDCCPYQYVVSFICAGKN